MGWSWTYVEYPRALHGAHGATVNVLNDEEKAAKLAEGWTLAPWSGDVSPEASVPWITVDSEPAEDYVAGETYPKRRGRKAKADD